MGDAQSENTEDASGTSVQFVHARNYILPEDQDEASIEELVVWGGKVANCAEHILSEMVDRQRNLLKSVTYCPAWTKGGVLIRPKYWLGNRAGTAVFPRLTRLSIRLDPSIVPQDYGWIMPALQRLRLLHVMHSFPQEDLPGAQSETCLPDRAALECWLDTTVPSSYSRRVLEASPELQSITVAVATTAGESQDSLDWIHLAPPQPVSWDVQRLLFLVVSKPHFSCAMSVLTMNLVSNIIKFLGTASWRRSIFKLPSEQLAQLGLPEDFESRALEGLL